ncbi:hypothetical protein E2C01_098856 [Portunus trituberculatus]|uniref:Uncharacterized protein n=1 Tax=Portunus trituberculatus TaxID=210409 RepID=A0A5B7K2A8_PORTR|nr:hypothetical protein [Portunus trituberculatus]
MPEQSAAAAVSHHSTTYNEYTARYPLTAVKVPWLGVFWTKLRWFILPEFAKTEYRSLYLAMD